MPGWRQPKDQARDQGDEETKGENPTVNGDNCVAEVACHGLREETSRPKCERHTGRTACEEEHGRLGEELADHSAACRAERRPKRELPVPRDSARQKQARDVGAGYKHH